eukprot:g2518.t1
MASPLLVFLLAFIVIAQQVQSLRRASVHLDADTCPDCTAALLKYNAEFQRLQNRLRQAQGNLLGLGGGIPVTPAEYEIGDRPPLDASGTYLSDNYTLFNGTASAGCQRFACQTFLSRQLQTTTELACKSKFDEIQEFRGAGAKSDIKCRELFHVKSCGDVGAYQCVRDAVPAPGATAANCTCEPFFVNAETRKERTASMIAREKEEAAKAQAAKDAAEARRRQGLLNSIGAGLDLEDPCNAKLAGAVEGLRGLAALVMNMSSNGQLIDRVLQETAGINKYLGVSNSSLNITERNAKFAKLQAKVAHPARMYLDRFMHIDQPQFTSQVLCCSSA